MPSKCACGCGWLVRAKGHFYRDHATNPPAADTFLAQAQAADKRYNGDENPNYGNAIVQERARVDNEERIAKMAKHEDILSDADAATLAQELSTTATGALHGCTLEELMGLDEDGYPYIADDDAPVPLETPLPFQCAFYIGYTGRHIRDEYLRWLTTRGVGGEDDASKTERNRPVLVWPDGTTITMKQAEQQLDFEYIEIYSSTLKLNARRVEKALQQRFQYLPLGVRLWRGPDKGSKYDHADDARKVHKVFVTFSPRVAQMLRERKIKIDY